MGDVGDYWNDYREYKREHKRKNARRDAERVDACVRELSVRGFDVVRFSEHHYRVDGRFDYWPTTGRWRSLDGKLTGSMLRPLLRALTPTSNRRARNDEGKA